MKNILLTGANGMLGTHISKIDLYNYKITSFSKKNGKNNLDITDSAKVKEVLEFIKPNFIVNCAAFTNVDKSEIDKKLTHRVNVHGLNNLIKYSSPKTKIIHISSDYVFDGTKGNYLENDITRPINYYGKTKLEAENILIGSNRPYTIFRPNVIFDFSSNNFFTFIYNSLKNKQDINIVNDQISNPTYAPHFAKIIIESIILDVEGVFHFGSLDNISRYDFALKIANFYNFNIENIKPISSKLLGQNAERPLNTSLNCNKIINNFDIEILPISYYLEKNKNYYE